jgi:methionyl-tRNA synthetase
MGKVFYITTPIYYVNDVPHIGSAYTTLAADIVSRYMKMKGRQVFFATGTDENAPKVAEAARNRGEDPQSFCDRMAEEFKRAWKELDISYDAFIRTTEPRHKKVVQSFVKELLKKGLVYEGYYKGWYCIYDETYFREEEVQDGLCPNPECRRPLQKVSERGYFFRLSAFQESLLPYLQDEKVMPDFRQREVLNFVLSGLRDLYITRKWNNWGIPFPGDEELQVYVWVDALINYLTVAGYLQDEEMFSSIWPPDVQVMGKDILVRFHATLWPAMLMALDLPLPALLFGHGFWTVNGEKMSKSKGNVVHPLSAVKEIMRLSGCEEPFARDALRFYLFRATPFGADGDFSYESLRACYNADLANNFGNLLNRLTSMAVKYLQGELPPPGADLSLEVETTLNEYSQAMERLSFHSAINSAFHLLDLANKHLDETAPWRLYKEGNLTAVRNSLGTAIELLRISSILLHPFLPSATKEILSHLGYATTFSLKEAKWGVFTSLERTDKIKQARPIFPRMEEVIKISTPEKEISIDEFAKIDLRVGKIKSCKVVEGAEKLYQMEIDLGELGTRRTVAGIAPYYKPEELIGKSVIFVANLTPAKIRGLISEGMVLAVDSPQGVVLVSPEKEVPPGSKVR